jgi:RHS repeat-associated protein
VLGAPLDARDASPPVTYHLCDHLGSSAVVVGGNGATRRNLINREEYRPYGETSFGSFAKKRYRYSGKERDEESGLYYYGARYYAVWMARWVSCDPIKQTSPCQQYHSASCNPINRKDRDGKQDVHSTTSDGDAQAHANDNISLIPVIGPTRDARQSFSQAIDAYFEGDTVMTVSHGLMGTSNTILHLLML